MSLKCLITFFETKMPNYMLVLALFPNVFGSYFSYF
jgi:hypothetical protein